MYRFLYLFQFLAERGFQNIRHYQKKFITAKSNQHICLTDIVSYDLDNRLQDKISCIMSISIIIKLKVIQVDHCNPGNHINRFELILIVTPVICTCQCIHIQLSVIPDQFLEHLIALLLAYQRISVQFVYQFCHVWNAINLNIFGHYLENAIIYKFKFCSLTFFCKGRPGNAVITTGILIPECIAFTSLCHICTSLKPSGPQFLLVKKAYN